MLHFVSPASRPSSGPRPRFCDRDIDKLVTWHKNHLSSSRGQLSDRPEYRLVELIQSSPIQSPVKSLTYFSAGQSKIDVIPVVGHRVLGGVNPKPIFTEWGRTYANDGEEDKGGTEGDLSWWDTTGVLSKV